MKRLFCIGLCLALVLGALPLSAVAESTGLCPHHPAHDESCGWSDSTPCQFVCQECGEESEEGSEEQADIALLAALPVLNVEVIPGSWGERSIPYTFRLSPENGDTEAYSYMLGGLYLNDFSIEGPVGTGLIDPSKTGGYTTKTEYTFDLYVPGNYTIVFSILDKNPPVQYKTYRKDFTVPAEGHPTLPEIIDSVAGECLQSCTTDYEKAFWLHEWVLDHCTYDNGYLYCHAEGALARGTGVCESYHGAYYLLLNKVGIETGRMTGNGHVWTAAKLDGQWYQIDTTWDDAEYATPGSAFRQDRYLYFAITDEMMAKVHSEHTVHPGFASNALADNYFIKTREIEVYSDPYYQQALTAVKSGATTLTMDASFDTNQKYFFQIINPLIAYDLAQRLTQVGYPAQCTYDYDTQSLHLTASAKSGKCGDDLTWVLDQDGIVTISGSGDMYDYDAGTAPWYSLKDTITGVSLTQGLTRIGSFAFANCSRLETVTIPAAVSSIGSGAFSGCTGLRQITFSGMPDSIDGTAFSQVSATAVCPESAGWTFSKLHSVSENLIWSPVHTYETTVVAATCTQSGYTLHSCKYCSEKYRDSEEPATGHQYVDTVTAPTCMENGYTTHTCSVCNDSYTDSFVEPIPNELVWAITKAPTCTEAGEKTGTCKFDCGYSETQPIPPAGHQYAAVVTPPTCTEKGYTTHTCSVCNDSYADSFVNPIPHELVWAVAKAPTCTEAGEKTGTCKFDCGYSEKESIAPTGHQYVTSVTPPTCTEKGYTAHRCSLCGDESFSDEAPALGHSYGSWYPSGSGEQRDCSRCGSSEHRAFTGSRLTLTGTELEEAFSVWIDGCEISVVRTAAESYIFLPQGSRYLTVYDTYLGTDGDIHTQYPTGMRIYRIDGNSIARIDQLDNLLQYAGSSIRITGTKGIRMITGIDKSVKEALTGDGLAGFTLEEYGTALCWASDLAGGESLTLGKSFVRSNYAYKKGVADPVFAVSGNQVQYTNVLVGFQDDQCIPDIAMRPYIILRDGQGETVTFYGGIVYRSIGYIAMQNRNVFSPGKESYNYVWSIIRHVYGAQFDEA